MTGIAYVMYVIRLIIIFAVSSVWAPSLLADTVAESVSAEGLADALFIDKSERRLELRRGDVVLRTYKIGLGGNPIGPKRQQGDQRTPEGEYKIDFRNSKSAYHRSLHINYPNATDRAASAKLGVPTGGDIFIHGLPNNYPLEQAPKIDWTLGCIAVNKDEIEEIWRLVPDGTPVTIVP